MAKKRNNTPNKSPNSQAFRWQTFKDHVHPYFRHATALHVASYMRLLTNNQYMLSITPSVRLNDQLRALRGKGLMIAKSTYFRILKGEYLSFNYTLPYYFADYWNIPVGRMLFDDLRLGADAQEALKHTTFRGPRVGSVPGNSRYEAEGIGIHMTVEAPVNGSDSCLPGSKEVVPEPSSNPFTD